jgi:TrmH family RNA methyltransferase
VITAVEAGAAVEAVFVETGAHQDLVARLRAEGVDVRPVRPGVLDRVLSTTSPQPLAAVAARPDPAGRRPGDGDGPVLVLAGVGDPGNVGTIIRSAVAGGAGPVLLGPHCADPFGPKAVRASAGTVFSASVGEVGDLNEALAELRRSGHTVLGAAPRGGRAHHDLDLTAPTVVVLGGEVAGLPEGVVPDATVSIPQPGPVESMNVAMAASVLVFEAARQRAARGSA